MKSLEIVNYKISLFKKDKQGFTALSWFQLNDIKQDLEVLEILRKYLYSKSYIVESYQGDREERTIEMQVIEENGKLLDYRKVFKWLEANENDR